MLPGRHRHLRAWHATCSGISTLVQALPNAHVIGSMPWLTTGIRNGLASAVPVLR